MEAPPWSSTPSVARVASIDQGLRFRLAELLAYLAEVAPFLITPSGALAKIERRLRSGPVSPWVFCLYSKLVSEVTKSPPGDASATLGSIVDATSFPAEAGIVGLLDQTVSAVWWDHFRILFDTNRQRAFKPRTPSPDNFAACEENIQAGLALLGRADPDFHSEVHSLVRMIVLGAPAGNDPADEFNGASTFFLWGGTLLNANLRRSSISVVDLLVHESSHVLLFGVSADGGLTENSVSERYASPVRNDKRPIDGIFHACFVATRVHLAMGRLVRSGALNHEEAKIATERAEYNGNVALSTIEELDLHARLTPLGENVLGTICDYWASVAAY